MYNGRNQTIYRCRPTLFYCASLYRMSQMLCFLQIKGKTLYQPKAYTSLYCDVCFIVVVWNRGMFAQRQKAGWLDDVGLLSPLLRVEDNSKMTC